MKPFVAVLYNDIMARVLMPRKVAAVCTLLLFAAIKARLVLKPQMASIILPDIFWRHIRFQKTMEENAPRSLSKRTSSGLHFLMT
jgi:hypothetical protein